MYERNRISLTHMLRELNLIGKSDCRSCQLRENLISWTGTWEICLFDKLDRDLVTRYIPI